MYTNIAIDVYGWTAWNIACTCVVYYVRSETNKRMNEVAHWSSLQRSSNRMHIIWTTLNNSRNFPTDARWELYEDDNDNADNNNNNPFRHHFFHFVRYMSAILYKFYWKPFLLCCCWRRTKEKWIPISIFDDDEIDYSYYYHQSGDSISARLFLFRTKKNCFFLFFAFSYFSNINSHCYLNRTHFVFTSIHHIKKWLSNSEVCK